MHQSYLKIDDTLYSAFGDRWQEVYRLKENSYFRQIFSNPNFVIPGFRMAIPDDLNLGRDTCPYDEQNYVSPSSDDNCFFTPTLITAYRHTDDRRYENINRFIKYYDKYKIIVAESGNHLTGHFNVTHLPTPKTESFNRSYLFNVGLLECESDIAVFIDSDILIDYRLLNFSANLCQDRDMVSPVCFFKENGEIRNGTTLGGGALIAKVDVIKSIGGWCEEIKSWGWEDHAVSIKVNRLSIKHTFVLGIGEHLSHPPNLDRRYYDQNEVFVRYLENIPLSVLKTYCNIASEKFND